MEHIRRSRTRRRPAGYRTGNDPGAGLVITSLGGVATLSSHLALILGGLLAVGAASADTEWDERFGDPAAQERLQPHDSPAAKTFNEEIRPILEQRCVVCHGCYDSPCQLNLGSPEGVERGANPDQVYSSARIKATKPTRLFIDAQTTSQWRDRDFFTVLGERGHSESTGFEAGSMQQLLALKQANPLPDTPQLPDSVTLGLSRKQSCPKPDDVEDYMQENPQWGMPYGLPGLADEDYRTLQLWLQHGAPMSLPAPLPTESVATVENWETFLNGDSLKQQLMSRYLYEHWFLAHLYFDDVDSTRFFRLVRSSTPPGEPVAEIASRRPYDDPEVERVYYRLIYDHSTVLDKTHMPYALDQGRMDWLKKLFLETDYEVSELPSFEPKVAANPFIAFAAIPVDSRWRFLLEEAQFTIMNFIKGPVCRGQVALNVIRDRFWVLFQAPEKMRHENLDVFFAENQKYMRVPVQSGSNSLPFTTWLRYAHSQSNYLEARTNALDTYYPDGQGLDLEQVWDGGGENANAALTVFRHFDSASVVKGLVGSPPETTWILDYQILERIHYLLVAGFDVYGNVGHQLTTRMFMDFLRMEGEFNFLLLLPPEERIRQREWWYEGASKKEKSYLFGKRANYEGQSGIEYKSDDPKPELYEMIRERLAPVLNSDYSLEQPDVPEAHRVALGDLQYLRGAPVAILPEVTILTVQSDAGYDYYTLIHNRAHSNITSLFQESETLRPEYDTLTVVKGFIGSYPDAYWLVDEEELPLLVKQMYDLRDAATYSAFMDRFGVRRTSPEFWAHSDRVMAAHKKADPIANGLLDYNRLENR